MDNERQNHLLWFIGGLVIGSLVGATLSLLFAPQSGKKTRRDIRRVSIDAKERTLKAAQKAKEAVDDFVEQSIEYVNEALGK